MVLQVGADRWLVIDHRYSRLSRRCAAGPMPESINICGVPNAPADNITAPRALIVRLRPQLCRITTPVARPFSTMIFSVSAPVTISIRSRAGST